MSLRNRYEICRFEHLDLLYRVYFFEDGEIAFTVTGDNMRLGLLTKEDLYWHWDWSQPLPSIEETSRTVNVQAGALHVLRTIALRLAQYLVKHRPLFFFYKVSDDTRRHNIYARLLQRHPQARDLYEQLHDDSGQYVLFTLK